MASKVKRVRVMAASIPANRPSSLPADRIIAPAEQLESSARTRVETLLKSEIDFVADPLFYKAGVEGEMLNPPELSGFDSKPSGSFAGAKDLPVHMIRLCETPLLSASEERALFRKFNYMKYRANVIRATLNPRRVDLKKLKEAEQWLQSANCVRDQIIRANVRLAVSVVKKFASPQCSFDEILSDGILTMMKAVEKFDYRFGFRFSTYAFRSIARTAYRSVSDRQRHRKMEPDGTELLLGLQDSRPSHHRPERDWESMQTQLLGLLSQLDEREQWILHCRSGLGDQPEARPFQSIADELGLSKERVRQLEKRAIDKLREMASRESLEDWMEPSSA